MVQNVHLYLCKKETHVNLRGSIWKNILFFYGPPVVLKIGVSFTAHGGYLLVLYHQDTTSLCLCNCWVILQ